MNANDILERIQPIFRDVFDNDSLVVTEKTVAADVEDWDSFAQMQITTGIEAMFGIKFSTEEVISFKNVGNIVCAIQKRTK